MRLAGILMFFVGAVLLPAQQPTTKVKTVSVSPTSPVSGKEMFDAYCASCHGAGGRGNGPAATAFKKAPTDLTRLAQKNNGKFPSAMVISSIQDGAEGAHGSKDMPVWGPILSSVSGDRQMVVQQRLTNLTSYIESLQAK